MFSNAPKLHILGYQVKLIGCLHAITVMLSTQDDENYAPSAVSNTSCGFDPQYTGAVKRFTNNCSGIGTQLGLAILSLLDHPTTDIDLSTSNSRASRIEHLRFWRGECVRPRWRREDVISLKAMLVTNAGYVGDCLTML